MADFQRLAPEARKHLRQGPGVWVRLKLDPWLLILLLAIMSFGLIVLYSGSGASEAAVQKQLIRYGVALLGMVIITQINLRLVQRWMPHDFDPDPVR
ncbi:MAG TPA: rod shape-determining protein RodA, partial [Oceanospirillaceae bacterium]|nr:rod shape-determining protein RodA [Oceanospirillaceae bacterium]